MRVDYENLERDELLTIIKEVGGEGGKRERINYPADTLPYVQHYRHMEQEHFIVLNLGGNHNVIRSHVISIGTVNRSIVHPREVFRKAIKDNAVAVMLVHNHPSGNTEPSKEDMEVTNRIADSGDIIGISVLDHIIISETGYYSFLEQGLMLKSQK